MTDLMQRMEALGEQELFQAFLEPEELTPEEQALVSQPVNWDSFSSDAMPGIFEDAIPRTLYVRRDLLNTNAVRAWARAQGIASVVPDMHVTICYSKSEVDWSKVGEPYDQREDGTLRVAPGGMRLVEELGSKGAVVLMFTSRSLTWRHESILQSGASSDYEDYQPHVTITYAGIANIETETHKIEPYRGELIFGPEVFEEINQDGFSAPQEIMLDGVRRNFADWSRRIDGREPPRQPEQRNVDITFKSDDSKSVDALNTMRNVGAQISDAVKEMQEAQARLASDMIAAVRSIPPPALPPRRRVVKDVIHDERGRVSQIIETEYDDE